MKLAYSTNGFTRVSLPTAIRRIAAAGYDGVEILADTPHWFPPSCGAGALAEVRRALRETGLQVSNINANTAKGLWPERSITAPFEPSLSNSDPAVRALRLEYILACLELAAEVGAPTVSVTSGCVEPKVPEAHSHELFVESLGIVCRRAETLGVKIGIEYEPGLLVASAHDVHRLIGRIDHPAFGANLDIGHAICAREEPAATIAMLADRTWNVHLEDIRGYTHYHLVPGDGDVDFAEVIGALWAHGYGGFLTVELYTCANWADASARRAITHLTPYLNDVIRPCEPNILIPAVAAG